MTAVILAAWLLISPPGTNRAMGSAPFETREACESAAAAINKVSYALPVFCVPTGRTP